MRDRGRPARRPLLLARTPARTAGGSPSPARTGNTCTGAGSSSRSSTCGAGGSRSGPASRASAATSRRAVTRMADAADQAGGDYWWTFFPQTSFVSSRRLWYHLDTSAYAVFDFTDRPSARALLLGPAAAPRHRFRCHDARSPRRPVRILRPAARAAGLDLRRRDPGHPGRHGRLPREARAGRRTAGVPVCGIWAQDWQGINVTSFGQRLRWNWEWDRERYPGLDEAIRAARSRGRPVPRLRQSLRRRRSEPLRRGGGPRVPREGREGR